MSKIGGALGATARRQMSTSFLPLSLHATVREPLGLLTYCSVEKEGEGVYKAGLIDAEKVLFVYTLALSVQLVHCLLVVEGYAEEQEWWCSVLKSNALNPNKKQCMYTSSPFSSSSSSCLVRTVMLKKFSTFS